MCISYQICTVGYTVTELYKYYNFITYCFVQAVCLGKNQSEQSDLTTDKVLLRKVSLLSKMAETTGGQFVDADQK